MSLNKKQKKSTIAIPSHVIDRDEVDKALTKFIVAAGLAFTTVEHESFIEFISMICKPYADVMPKRRTVSGRLLKQVYDETLPEIKKKLEGSDVCLLADSWKNTSGKHQNFAVVIHNAGEEAVFVDSYNMNEQRETAENLAEAVSYSKIETKSNQSLFILTKTLQQFSLCPGKLSEF